MNKKSSLKKETRHPIEKIDVLALKKRLLHHLSAKSYQPTTQTALFTELKLTAKEQKALKEIITDLLTEEEIFVEKKKLFLKKQKPSNIVTGNVVTGTLRMHPRGFGFVIVDGKEKSPDIFIPKHLTDGGVDGDTVEVAIHPVQSSPKGPDGKITKILKRGRSHIAGTIQFVTSSGDMIAFIPLLGQHKPARVVACQSQKIEIGDRVILKVLEWGNEEKDLLCEVYHKIGNILDPSLDIIAATEEFNLLSSFSKGVMDEVQSFEEEVPKKDLKGRMDLSTIECFTIDPQTAKDFDDALSIRKTENGHFHLGVHIADVAHYVKRGSLLDKEAYQRANSTYFPGECIPMLPFELSNHLCSLKPHTNRLCISALMEFDTEGTLIHYEIVRSYIHSAKRFTYEEAKEIIDGKKSPHKPAIDQLVELCLLLKKKRYERGSVDFALPEVVIEVDPKGKPLGYKIVEYDISHQLVEECMLKANEVVAKYLTDKSSPALFRIHEPPSGESLEDFLSLARTLGFSIKKDPGKEDIQKLFEEAKPTPHAGRLAVGFIRSMKLAYYSKENVGHFGLCLEHYCHFTSPIRRYPDLIIQRLLFKEQPLDSAFDEIALQCSERERLSFKAEQSVKTLKKLRLLSQYFQEDPKRIYEATITKIKPFGLSFELEPLSIEGFIHISELGADYFIFNAQRGYLIGERTGKKFVLGAKIDVYLESIDFILMEAKWARCREPADIRPKAFSHEPSRKRKRRRR